ncbi:ATP-dependent deoxyribonuclease subunit A [Sorangium cellulosum]|uniref:DNA 3'-5' helicase n=1 Tax=Sorangium cellulosum TaxID=56 RepID=A0A2L0EHF2_SORCE|nr:UvrD-helicase domain-containing protein [Sorangium cellulosum]AUX38722.1 ATP-dependent deoxyribonuclease subunit A [Sorangium cellulosum]
MTADPGRARGVRELADEPARRRIREDLRTTLVVEAAAGTGKTTALVSRIVAVLRKGPEEGGGTLDRIVAVTFTEKAAGEMKLRLRAEIERARSDPAAGPAERARLDEALAHLEAARIGTIHSFCADLLREWPVEARVDPLFQVAAADHAEALFDQAFDAWFQRTLNDPPEGVRRILRRRPRDGAQGPRDLLRSAAYKLAEHRDFTRPWRRDPFDRERALDEIIGRLASLADLAAEADREDDYLAQGLRNLDRYLAELRRREEVTGGRDHDGLEAELAELARWKEWRWKGAGKSFGADLSRAEVLALRDRVKAELDAVLTAASADLAACLSRELRPPIEAYDALKARAGKLDFLDLLLCARNLLRSSRGVREELNLRFSHLFVDEFQDTDPLQAEILLLLAADDPAETDWMKARPLPGKLFVVGDPKQSIYRFRRAEVALYEATKARLVACGASVLYLSTSFRSAPSIQEAVNGAFAPLMQGGGDERPGARAASQARYVALERFRDDPVGQPTVIALPVPRPYGDFGKISDFRVRQSIPDAVGAFVHHLIHAGRGSASGERRWTVTERERPRERVPLEARHICLLFKRFQTFGEDATRAYVRALEARRIPHVLVGGRSFHDREEVMAVRSALSAIEWPDDELSVYAALRGPLFALTDDVLLLYRDRFQRLHPLFQPDDAALEAAMAGGARPLREVAEALAVLGRLHRERNRRPIADTIGGLLDETRAHAGIAIWPTGEQALANVLRVMDLGRRFEAGGATSFRAFVERLEADAERGEVAEAPVVEEGTEGVRIMTVHRAKGLEFPVVILADPASPAVHQQPSRHVDPELNLWAEPIAGCVPAELWERRDEVLRRDREEAVRLAYVAATRARDLLVVPAVGDARPGDGSSDGWLDVLHPVLYPAPRERRNARPGDDLGCPRFGTDTVLERSARCEADERDAVAPGVHAPMVGAHRVVWWDPGALDLDREPEAGLRQQRILQADAGGAGGVGGAAAAAAGGRGQLGFAQPGLQGHEAWQEARERAIRDGAAAAVRVKTATELSHEAAAAAAAAAAAEAAGVAEGAAGGAGRAQGGAARGGRADALPVISFEQTAIAREGRPFGKRFGTLVHAVLAEVDLRAGEDEVREVAAAQARLLAAPAEEVDAAVAAALAALDHPLLRRAAESAARGACERETPLLLRLPDGTLVEGVVDLSFRESVGDVGIWTVIDFKTGSDAGTAHAAQEAQVRLYVEAIAEATGERARGVVLRV